ncbi:MAG: histone deacetylase [Chloroflexi bacterium]|nr:histone deacetylase [Chloroflexota bacterium]
MNIFPVPSLEHNSDDHPENAKRIPAILAALNGLPSSSSFTQSVHPSNFPAATDEQLATVHDPEYVAALRQVMSRAPAYIDHAPTYITPQSFDCAALAAGAALAAVQSTIENQKSAMALIRPPGHHAPPSHAMGFCLFNNVALAARHAQRLGLPKVMIVDFDVHHGNGTQDCFYSDSSVLFVSTHQAGIYPLTGHVEETGSGAGDGTTVNIPLPAGAGDDSFRRLFDEIILPAADRFQPNILLVSAGYDAHWRDPLASLQLSCAGYHWLAGKLAEVARKHCAGKLVFVLEGGYDLPALAHGVANTLLGALGGPPADPLGPSRRPEPDITNLLARVKALHDF